ncbi:MAG: glycosyltransferase family 1 protein [Deltaproteobacteria bacterium]|nr:glycosyltransferase family 1 protein [Deltaproteobacteria bacterium]
MGNRKKIVMLRSVMPHSTVQYYFKAMKRLDVDVIDAPFDPRKNNPDMALPEGDLLLLVDCGLPVDFRNLENYGCPKHYVSIDSCHKLSIHKAYCERYKFDHIWVAQKHVVSELGPNARWLPLAADEDIHVFRHDMDDNRTLKERLFKKGRYDIGMCGAPYKHRRRFEKLFKKAGLTTNFYFREKFGVDATIETARSTIGFNAAAGFTGEKGKDINMRVFETMANGRAMLLTNTYDGLGYEELFEEARHYIGFRTEGEAMDKAVYYARRPEEAMRIAEEGQRHVLSNHTYLHRCKTILSVPD